MQAIEAPRATLSAPPAEPSPSPAQRVFNNDVEAAPYMVDVLGEKFALGVDIRDLAPAGIGADDEENEVLTTPDATRFLEDFWGWRDSLR